MEILGVIKLRQAANESISTHVTFTLRRKTCFPVTLISNLKPQASDTLYFGMHRRHSSLHRIQLCSIHRKQTFTLQRHNITSLELRSSAVANSEQNQRRNSLNILVCPKLNHPS